MKRFFDFIFSLFLILGLSPLYITIVVLVKLTSKGPSLYWSERVGINNQTFLMPKFRSMHIDTPQVATHLLGQSQSYTTPLGRFLRKSSFDELPQLWSVLKGDMSFVGPRPALFNQDDLIKLRTAKGIEKLIPGITGWAQINGRDELPIPVKVSFDEEYLNKRSMLFDFKIILLTVLKVLRKDGVSH